MREQAAGRQKGVSRFIFLALIVVIFGCAALLRFAGINWDQYQHVHPDERFIVWVADTLTWPGDLATALPRLERAVTSSCMKRRRVLGEGVAMIPASESSGASAIPAEAS